MKFSLVEFDKAYKEEVKKLIKETLKSYGFLIDKEREKIIDEFVEKNYPLESCHYEEIIDKIIGIYKNKVFYVWFDAPIGYLTNTIYASEGLNFNDSLEEALKKIKGKWKNWFANNETKIIHFIGKDNIPFHTTFWPGMIISFNKALIEKIEFSKKEFEPNKESFRKSLSIEVLSGSFQEYLMNKLSEEEKGEFWKSRNNPKKIKEMLDKLNIAKELEKWFKENRLKVEIKEEKNKFVIKENPENAIKIGSEFISYLDEIDYETHLFSFLAYLLGKKIVFVYPVKIKFREPKEKKKEVEYKQYEFVPNPGDFFNSLSYENIGNNFQNYLINKLSEKEAKKFFELREDPEKLKIFLNKKFNVIEEFKNWLKERGIRVDIKEEKDKLVIEEKNCVVKGENEEANVYCSLIEDYKSLFPFLAYLLGKKVIYIFPSKIKIKRLDNELLNEKLNLPYNVVGYNYLNYEGQKFSKSQGIGIFLSPENLPVLKEIPIDAWRFYLISILPEQKDSDFSWQDFEEKYNKELLGNFANFVYRVLSFAKKNNLLKAKFNFDLEKLSKKVNKEKVKELLNKEEFKELKESLEVSTDKLDFFVSNLIDLTENEKLRDKVFEFAKETLEEKYIDFLLFTLLYKIRNNLIQKYEEKMNPGNVKLKEALQIALKLSDIGNKQFQKFEPWKKIKENKEETEKFIVTMLNYVYSLAYLIYPFMPETAEKIAKMLNIKIEKFDNAYLVKDNFELREIEHLFEKIDFNKVRAIIELKNNKYFKAFLWSFDIEFEECIKGNKVNITCLKEKTKYYNYLVDILPEIKLDYSIFATISNEGMKKLIDLIIEMDKNKDKELLKLLKLIPTEVDDAIKEVLEFEVNKNEIVIKNNNLNNGIKKLLEIINSLLKNYKIVFEEKKENKKGEKMEEGLISIDDFFKVKLRVGKIISVEEPKELKKLYKLTVAFDKEGKETRTILAGLKNYYKPEELKGRIVIVVYNLKPKKVAGYISEGMLLAAEKDNKLELATVNSEDLIGAYLN
ncbi:MAG: class I tRNA ligase family protein [Nanoarchaeota archaeon]